MKKNYLSTVDIPNYNLTYPNSILDNEEHIVDTVVESPELRFDSEVKNFIWQKFPQYYHSNITKPKQAKIKHMNKIFAEFDEIAQEKHKHNLKWALKKAKDEFSYNQLKKAQPTKDCFGAFDDVVLEVKKHSKKKIDKLSRRFSILSTAVSFFDIVVSVALILIVTILSHLGEKMFDTVLVSTLFIGVVALTKVSLDRFAIMPIIDNYGWKLFEKSIVSAKDESIKINGVYLVLLESIARNEPLETRFAIIHQQKDNLIATANEFPASTVPSN